MKSISKLCILSLLGRISAGFASVKAAELRTNLVELALVSIERFYDFLNTPTDDCTIMDYNKQHGWILDIQTDSVWLYYARLIREVLLPPHSDNAFGGSALKGWEILYGLKGYDSFGQGSYLWSEEPCIILQSPVFIICDDSRWLKVFKQVSFILSSEDIKGLYIGSVWVNGMPVLVDIYDKYWALKPNFWTKDLWRRLGIRATRPSNDYLFLDREASQMAAERDLGYATRISSKRTDTQGVKSGSIAVGDDELRAALDLIYEFYDHLLKGSPPEKCPSIFAVQFGEINQLSEDDNVRVWRLFQEMREALDITRFSLTREKREMEWLKESVRQFSLIVRHYYPRRPMHSRDFFYVVYRRNAFKDEGEFFVSDPFMVQEIWVPVARFEDGFRIVYNEVMVNGIPIYQLGFTELPPAIELWKALGFPMDPDKVRRARVMLTRFRMEAEDRANGPWR